jgi:hypothetical protein
MKTSPRETATPGAATRDPQPARHMNRAFQPNRSKITRRPRPTARTPHEAGPSLHKPHAAHATSLSSIPPIRRRPRTCAPQWTARPVGRHLVSEPHAAGSASAAGAISTDAQWVGRTRYQVAAAEGRCSSDAAKTSTNIRRYISVSVTPYAESVTPSHAISMSDSECEGLGH